MILPRSHWPCAKANQYDICEKELGRGTYGAVFKGIHRETGARVAMKRMEPSTLKTEQGFPITTFREIKLLQNIQHPNILAIKEVVYETHDERHQRHPPKPIVYLVLDLMNCDLAKLIDDPHYHLSYGRIQFILREMLSGLAHLHSKNIAHRDLKPSNILLGPRDVKISDFGLAKQLSPSHFSTLKVVTLWYRAPELLLGYRAYSTKIDIWSAGCVAVEMLLLRPLFATCNSEKEVLRRMIELSGSLDEAYELMVYGEEITNHEKSQHTHVPQSSKPNEVSNPQEDGGVPRQVGSENLHPGEASRPPVPHETNPNNAYLEMYLEVRPKQPMGPSLIYFLKEELQRKRGLSVDDTFLDLVERMLRLNPLSRNTAAQCLEHAFFQKSWPFETLFDVSS